MNRPTVKICGVTREEEIAHLSELGVDFFGLVTDVPSPRAIPTSRVRQLAALGNARLRPTLVTRPHPPDTLKRLIEETGVTAIQLGVLTLPKHIRQLRRTFSPDRLVVIQHIPYRQGRFPHEEQAGEYLAAGADFLLLDQLDKTGAEDKRTPSAIPEDDLIGFRERHQGLPLLVAGGISAENVLCQMTASGAIGIDVCSSVRRDGTIRRELVAELIARLANSRTMRCPTRPALDALLKAAPPGNHVIAYLTLGDPPDRFLEVADESLAAGALTLELGFPHTEPHEGATLAASHRRALDAGVEAQKAFALFQAVARRHPDTPLVAVVQWPAIQSEDDRSRFLDGLVEAGAGAVLPVGLPLWQLPAFAADVHARGLQTAIPCPPNASRKFRNIAFRYCSGCIYVPRGRTTGDAAEFANCADFCHLVARETTTPLVVGVGVRTAEEVAEICRTPAKAAAVGSALVEHVIGGGSAGDFIRRLVARQGAL